MSSPRYVRLDLKTGTSICVVQKAIMAVPAAAYAPGASTWTIYTYSDGTQVLANEASHLALGVHADGQPYLTNHDSSAPRVVVRTAGPQHGAAEQVHIVDPTRGTMLVYTHENVFYMLPADSPMQQQSHDQRGMPGWSAPSGAAVSGAPPGFGPPPSQHHVSAAPPGFGPPPTHQPPPQQHHGSAPPGFGPPPSVGFTPPAGTCPAGHALYRVEEGNARNTCNGCQRQVPYVWQRCAQCDYDICPPCLEKRSHGAGGDAALTCERGHVMSNVHNQHAGNVCNRCRNKVQADFSRCAQCDYDLCSNCAMQRRLGR